MPVKVPAPVVPTVPAWLEVVILAFIIALVFYALWVWFQLEDMRSSVEDMRSSVAFTRADAQTKMDSAIREARYARNTTDTMKDAIAENRSTFAIQLIEAQRKADRLVEDMDQKFSTFRDAIMDDLGIRQKLLTDEIARASDIILNLSRDALKLDKERLNLSYGALVRGVDQVLHKLNTRAEANDQWSGWKGTVEKSREELIALWKELEADAVKTSFDVPREAIDSGAEALQSEGRLDVLLEDRLSLRSKRKRLGKWFESLLPLWQEVESACQQHEQGSCDRGPLAQDLDQILVAWQAQTDLRLLEPVHGDVFNESEMSRAGEAPVEAGDAGRVVELRRRGYAWAGRVLEPAAVVVGVKRDG